MRLCGSFDGHWIPVELEEVCQTTYVHLIAAWRRKSLHVTDWIPRLTLRIKRAAKLSLIGSVLLITIMGLTGCAQGASSVRVDEPAAESTGDSTPEPKPERALPEEPKSEPTPVPSPAVLPSCEEMLPLHQAVELLGSPAVQFYGAGNDPDWALDSRRLGPATKAAVSQASESVTCTWAIPNSDGFIFFSVSRLPEVAKNELVAALRASDYVESAHGNAPIFTYDDGARGIGFGPIRLAFVGPFIFHTQDPRDGGPALVIDNIQAANIGHEDFA